MIKEGAFGAHLTIYESIAMRKTQKQHRLSQNLKHKQNHELTFELVYLYFVLSFPSPNASKNKAIPPDVHGIMGWKQESSRSAQCATSKCKSLTTKEK